MHISLFCTWYVYNSKTYHAHTAHGMSFDDMECSNRTLYVPKWTCYVCMAFLMPGPCQCGALSCIVASGWVAPRSSLSTGPLAGCPWPGTRTLYLLGCLLAQALKRARCRFTLWCLRFACELRVMWLFTEKVEVLC